MTAFAEWFRYCSLHSLPFLRRCEHAAVQFLSHLGNRKRVFFLAIRERIVVDDGNDFLDVNEN
jgi:hypothetical protein